MSEALNPANAAAASAPAASVVPPIAARQSFVHTLHGLARADDYHWLADHDARETRDYLAEERAFYAAQAMHTRHLRERLLDEATRRTPLAEASVSWRLGDFVYHTQTDQGREFNQLFRSPRGGGAEQSILDLGEFGMATGFAALGVCAVSPDGRLLAYSIDTSGEEVYELRFRDLATGKDLPDRVGRTYYTGGWSADSGTFFYTVPDSLYRPHEVRRHRLGTDSAADPVVASENDARFELSAETTRSGELIAITAASRDTTEVWLVPAGDPEAAPRLVRARHQGVEYQVDHASGRDGGDLLIVTDAGWPEFRLMRAPLAGPEDWTELVPPGPGERLIFCDVFARHLVLTLRRDSTPLLRILRRDGSADPIEIHPGVPAGMIVAEHNEEYDTDSIIVATGSYVEPMTWYDVDLGSGARTVRKRAETPGHDPEAYVTERRFASARDGTPIPVTLAYRAGTPLDGTAPCLMYGYGAYESCDEPAYDPPLACLLDRGVVFAHAHVRGGGEMGRDWWLAGRLAAKATTFTDYLAVADWLAGSGSEVGAGLVAGDRIATRGLSAGGLLQGAVLSMRPDRFRAIVAEVPFVDVVTTMSDPDIPLTVNEWDEWGNPHDPADYAVMLAYSPYDNVPDGPLPRLLVTGALQDPRVPVHEPAKWVAKLRASAADGAPQVLFRAELGAGAHTGPSGRFAYLAYEAEVLAFILDAVAGDPGSSRD